MPRGSFSVLYRGNIRQHCGRRGRGSDDVVFRRERGHPRDRRLLNAYGAPLCQKRTYYDFHPSRVTTRRRRTFELRLFRSFLSDIPMLCVFLPRARQPRE